MSTITPPRIVPRRHCHRSSRHYYNTSSSQSLSHSSGSNNSFNLENGGGQASPQPPPLPQRPVHNIGAANRDSYYCWSDGSGSTRLPAFPEEENDSLRSSHLVVDTIRYGKSRQPMVHKVRHSNKTQLGCAAYQHRAPVVATAVVYPSTIRAGPVGNVLLTTASMSPSSPSGSAIGGGFRGYPPDDSGGYVARGCGGRCETCENVCYYLLQVSFAMGVLIGTSLCIAGAALRRSPGRQLQVLLYIGALVALVCALLLIVQCRTRRQAHRYYQQQNQQLHTVDAARRQQQQQPKPVAMNLVAVGNNVQSLQSRYVSQINQMYQQPGLMHSQRHDQLTQTTQRHLAQHSGQDLDARTWLPLKVSMKDSGMMQHQ